MTPLAFTLEGSKGILAGQGKETLSMDLERDIPDDAITVYLHGDNGSGKSTVMDLGLNPWREPPQVPGDIYDAFGAAGLRLLEWSHGTERYRSRIEYRRTEKTKSQKAYLHVMRDGEWVPYQMPDLTVSDGKASTYDACVAHILGDREIYFLSAFRAQGARKLAEYKDAKGLMRALLALEEVESKREKARKVVTLLTRRRDALRADYERAHALGAEIEEKRSALPALKERVPAKQKVVTVASAAMTRASAELNVAVSAGLDEVKLREAREAQSKRIEDAIKRGNETAAALGADIEARLAQMKRTEAQFQKEIETIDAQIRRAEQRIVAANKTLGMREQIARAAVEVDDLSEQLTGKERTIDDLQEKRSQLAQMSSKVAILEAELANTKKSIDDLQIRKQELQKRASFVAQVPCRGEGKYSKCPALCEAQMASSEIVDVDRLQQAQEDEIQVHTAKLAKLRPQATEAEESAVNEQLRTMQAELSALRGNLDALRLVAARAETLEHAQEIREQAQTELDELEVRAQTIEGERTKQNAQWKAELDGLEARRMKAMEIAVEEQANLRHELAQMPEPSADSAIAKAKRDVQITESNYHNAVREADMASASLATAVKGLELLEEQFGRLGDIARNGKILSEEIAIWTVIAKGLRGVIDLSIEDAGPAIASYANQLLTKAYGPRFSIKIVTQRERANGDLAECFDISVIDAESGLESSAVVKSGGEAVWIDKALTDAVGLYHQESTGAAYECLFADECEDGLTQERKAQFYSMDREALRLGGFRRKIVVSHNPEAWAQADHVIDFDRL